MNNNLICNCWHSYADHKSIIDIWGLGQTGKTWCIYSEYGQCPCDYYTSMTNLEYLEWRYNKNDF